MARYGLFVLKVPLNPNRPFRIQSFASTCWFLVYVLGCRSVHQLQGYSQPYKLTPAWLPVGNIITFSSIFIAHQHAMDAERDIITAFVSVCPMPVLYLNEWTYRQTFWRSGRGIILVFSIPTDVTKFQHEFLQMSPFMSETVRDRLIVTIKH